MNSTIKPAAPNHLLYQLASAVSDPLADKNGSLLQNKVTRIVLALITLYATFGAANLLASIYVDLQDQKFRETMQNVTVEEKPVTYEEKPSDNQSFEDAMRAVRAQLWSPEEFKAFYQDKRAG
ncbi:hypothetical protein K0U07_05795 [bacterium]|nr:hypothetical protein [bacterium]